MKSVNTLMKNIFLLILLISFSLHAGISIKDRKEYTTANFVTKIENKTQKPVYLVFMTTIDIDNDDEMLGNHTTGKRYALSYLNNAIGTIPKGESIIPYSPYIEYFVFAASTSDDARVFADYIADKNISLKTGYIPFKKNFYTAEKKMHIRLVPELTEKLIIDQGQHGLEVIPDTEYTEWFKQKPQQKEKPKTGILADIKKVVMGGPPQKIMKLPMANRRNLDKDQLLVINGFAQDKHLKVIYENVLTGKIDIVLDSFEWKANNILHKSSHGILQSDAAFLINRPKPKAGYRRFLLVTDNANDLLFIQKRKDIASTVKKYSVTGKGDVLWLHPTRKLPKNIYLGNDYFTPFKNTGIKVIGWTRHLAVYYQGKKGNAYRISPIKTITSKDEVTLFDELVVPTILGQKRIGYLVASRNKNDLKVFMDRDDFALKITNYKVDLPVNPFQSYMVSDDQIQPLIIPSSLKDKVAALSRVFGYGQK